MAAEICMPQVLIPGDSVGIALASPVEEPRLNRGIRYLERKGCRVIRGKTVSQYRGYLAGSDTDRVADFHGMIENPEVTGILAAKGGYGSGRLLDLIRWRKLAEAGKPFVGFSDMTALQLAMLARAGLGSYYGPMVSIDMRRSMPARTEQSFWEAVGGETQRIHGVSWKTGRVEGTLVGGCLSVVASILGSRYVPDFKGAILFLEEVEEQPYQIDRLLNQLRLAGVLRAIGGMAFGRFVRCGSRKPDYRGPSAPDVLREAAAAVNIPVVGALPFGHIRAKMTLPIGKTAILDGESGELIC